MPELIRSKRRLASRAGLVAASLCPLLALAGCFGSQSNPDRTTFGGDGGATRNVLDPDPRNQAPESYYRSQLVELPLRIKSYDLTGNERTRPVVIREMHVIQDRVRDEILVIDADGPGTMWSLHAHDFTLHWKTPIENRVTFRPMATSEYIVLMDSDGLYQAYDRMNSPRQGESRLIAKGRFEGEIFPSAEPASNDTHVFVPATNSNSMRGLSMIDNAKGQGTATWSFPDAGQGVQESFMQVRTRPAADSESVAFINNNGRLYIVDAQTGEFRANPHLDGHSRTPPVIKNDLVFVGSDSGQIFAWEKSGEAAWTATVDGLPYGEMFIEDNWVFVRTLEVYDEEVRTDDGRGVRLRAATRPGMLHAFKYERRNVERDRPVFEVVDGDPSTPWIKDPIWSEPDVGQQILMLSGDNLFVLYETNVEFLSEKDKARLRDTKRIANRRDELRTTDRRIRVLDVSTGRLGRPEWDLNMIDFPFIQGSMLERDRAIYLGTRDGHIFKVYAQGGRAGGN